jgi:hypothetical protein
MREQEPQNPITETSMSMYSKIFGIALATGTVAIGGAIAAKKQFDKRHDIDSKESPDESR